MDIWTPIDMVLHFDRYLAGVLQTYGVWTYGLLFVIVFLETGLVVTPFLPGDSLLFVTGMFAAQDALNVWLAVMLLSFAAILGDTVNYWLGAYGGKKLFARWINREHLERTEQFYARHGGKTIVLARFVPIIRTFAPFVAGIGAMSYPRFIMYNIVGGLAWVASLVFLGFFLGTIPVVKENLGTVVMAIIVLSLVPVGIEVTKHRKRTFNDPSLRPRS